MRERDNTRRVQTFNIDAVEEQYFDTSKEDDLEIHTVQCESHYINDKRRSLIRVVSNIEINGNRVAVPMLIDSGSTSSIINPSLLPVREAEIIRNFMENGTESRNLPLRKIKVTMSAALDTKVLECAFGENSLSGTGSVDTNSYSQI